MEGISKSSIELTLELNAQQTLFEEEARKLAAEAELRRQEELLKSQEARRQVKEAESKSDVFSLLDHLPVPSGEPLIVKNYWYDSDDGISDSEDDTWQVVRSGEVFIFSRETKRQHSGWSGSKNSNTNMVWLFASDIGEPIVAEGSNVKTVVSASSINMERFKPSSWRALEEAIRKMEISLEREKLLDKADALTREHGSHQRSGLTADGQRIQGEPVFDRLVVEAADETKSTWRLIAINDIRTGERTRYALVYKSDDDDGFSIELDTKNSKPWVWDNSPSRNTRNIHRDHQEIFKQGLEYLSEAVEPTLFSMQEL